MRSDYVKVPAHEVGAYLRKRAGLLAEMLDPADLAEYESALDLIRSWRPRGRSTPPTFRMRLPYLYDPTVETEEGEPIVNERLQWRQIVANVVVSRMPAAFSLSELYTATSPFYALWPNNNTPDDTVRRLIGELSDLGILVERTSRGEFRKLES